MQTETMQTCFPSCYGNRFTSMSDSMFVHIGFKSVHFGLKLLPDMLFDGFRKQTLHISLTQFT